MDNGLMSDSAQNSPERLNKHLAALFGLSRREADEKIASGQVEVNGKKAIIGQRVSEDDVIKLASKTAVGPVTYKYIAMNKPVGYVCSRRSQGGDKTIYELLPAHLKSLKTVGRLDKNSSGLILLTNDGDFSHSLTHPSFHKNKLYNVRLDRNLEPLHQQMISDYGVQLEDGVSQLGLTRLSDEPSERREWQVSMSEGRNRQIRRTFQSLGYEVEKLNRLEFGSYRLGDLKRGDWQEIKP